MPVHYFWMIVFLATLVIGIPTPSLAQPFEYVLRESLILPFSLPPGRVLAVRDMDADSHLDVVLARDPTLTILEQAGSGLATRFTYSAPEAPSGLPLLRSPWVAEVDGDETPELIAGERSSHQVHIWESDGNDSYIKRFAFTIGVKIDSIKDGDSDGDGQREFLVGRESFPSQVIILEATADNSYASTGLLVGNGGDVVVAGTADLDRDGAPETVFSDNSFRGNDWQLYVFENRNLIFTNPSLGLAGSSLGDTDGNGRGEIIGPLPGTLKVLESTGMSNNFQIVLEQVTDYMPRVLDVDGDGRSEFWRSILDETGERRIFTLATRSGSEFVDLFDSGSLLQGTAGDIRQVLAIGDTNADGGLELAVQQGTTLLHILEPTRKLPPNCNDGINAVRNCGFDTDLARWMQERGTFQHVSNDGSAKPGSMNIVAQVLDKSPSQSAADALQCIPVMPRTAYDFRVDARVIQGPITNGCAVSVTEFSTLDCSGGGLQSETMAFTPVGIWTRSPVGTLTTMAEAVAVELRLSCHSTTDSFEVRADDFFLSTGPVPVELQHFSIE